MAEYHIYILSNASGMFYLGLTTDAESMLKKHRAQRVLYFKANFAFNKLVYIERWHNPNQAVKRYTYLKSLSRIQKNKIIRADRSVEPAVQELIIKKSA